VPLSATQADASTGGYTGLDFQPDIWGRILFDRRLGGHARPGCLFTGVRPEPMTLGMGFAGGVAADASPSRWLRNRRSALADKDIHVVIPLRRACALLVCTAAVPVHAAGLLVPAYFQPADHAAEWAR